MERDLERIDRLRHALAEAKLDVLVGSLPADVLLLTGYWPVVGTAVALVTRDGRVAVLAPKDEEELARQGWADELQTFEPASLDQMRDAEKALREPLRHVLRSFSLAGARVGYEPGPVFEPASYSSMHLYGDTLPQLLQNLAARPVPAREVFGRLKAVKTAREIERIRVACRIAGHAFEEGKNRLRPGLRETEAAAFFATPLSTFGVGHDGVARAGGSARCMSGPDSAKASGAYARSRAKVIGPGELVLVHCNSYADGYWTDITRTYCTGTPDERKQQILDAVLAARAAALAAIRPGAKASTVDRAARAVLEERGFGKQFKHPTGHGVGFRAIDHTAHPRLHPQSDEVLETGMVFNVEPAVYIDGYGGLRHCDVVAVTGHGVDVLTPFQTGRDHFMVAG